MFNVEINQVYFKQQLHLYLEYIYITTDYKRRYTVTVKIRNKRIGIRKVREQLMHISLYTRMETSEWGYYPRKRRFHAVEYEPVYHT